MRIKRKPLLLEAWYNSKEPRPDGHPAEPMPDWLSKNAERAAIPGSTFLALNKTEEMLIHAGHIVYKDTTGGIHSIPMDRFKAEYEIVNLNKPVGEDPAKDGTGVA